LIIYNTAQPVYVWTMLTVTSDTHQMISNSQLASESMPLWKIWNHIKYRGAWGRNSFL